MSLLATFQQQPADRLDYDIDYSKWLESGDSIASATVVAAPTTTETIALVSTPVVKVWFSGGLDRVSYKLTVTVTTAAGRIKQDELRIVCKEI